MLPSKHSSWWRRTEDVFKTSSRRLRCNIFLSYKTSWRHNCKTSCKHVLKTSWRRFRKTYCKYVLKTSWRRLQERSWKTKSVTLKTSSRRLEGIWKIRNVCWVTSSMLASVSLQISFLNVSISIFNVSISILHVSIMILNSLNPKAFLTALSLN